MVALAALSAACTIGFSYYLAGFIADVFRWRYAESSLDKLFFMLVFGLTRATIAWLQEVMSVRASAVAKLELRQAFWKAVQRLGSSWLSQRNSNDLALLATSRIDALDSYFARFLPSLVGTALVTPIMTAVIFTQDFWSGVAVLCTLPLIPLFMIFIGWATQEVQRRQLDSLSLLSRHFGEVLRGLTTLRVFGRLPHQPAAIAVSSENFRIKTMRVLRMSFLSGLALEVAASLSVALVAVSIGLRLIDGTLLLGPGLFALLLAPEAYLPLRQVGANFHASNEGVLASEQILDVISAGATAVAPARADTSPYVPGRVTRIIGASGAGKTSEMEALRAALPREQVSWVPQESRLLPGTVRSNILGPTDAGQAQALQTAIELAALDDVDLDHVVGDTATGLSGGQIQRVAIARAFYRAITKPVDWLLLDEPLSALDGKRSTVVQQGIRGFAERGLHVVLISHQSVFIEHSCVEVNHD